MIDCSVSKTEILTRLNDDIHKLPYSQQQIIECAIRKAESQEFQDCYGTDYNDCHGDYYDAEYS